ncbi:MAG: Ppx/GppA phosphatase family protein [Balneolaceae bacterium]|nr:Ppx/GppA phosphatase family protein [Balneolaceae bacterium]
MFASIDIGTNTVLLLIAEYVGDKLTVIHVDQRIPRLGKGVDENRNLSDRSIQRVINALKEYRRLIDHYYPQVEQTIVTATSAVRDSANQEQFLKQVKQKTGFDVRILSGEEEAEWTYLGARSMMPPDADLADQLITLDIGGGSTEVSLGRNDELIDFHSFDIGSVRFTERFIHSDPPKQEEIQACRKAIKTAFEDRLFSWEGEAQAIGVAGTVTSLAFMEAGLVTYDPQELAGMKMTKKQVSEWIKELSQMTTAELLKEHPVVMEGRADVFLPGILILEVFLSTYNFDDFLVSTGGVRHGAILKLYQQKKGAG